MTINTLLMFHIDAQRVQDSVSTLLGNIAEGGMFVLNTELGENNDTLIVNAEGYVDGALGVVVAGGDNDVEDFIWMGFRTDIGPRGDLDVFCHGGHDPDRIECRYSGVLEGRANFYLYGNDFHDFDASEAVSE